MLPFPIQNSSIFGHLVRLYRYCPAVAKACQFHIASLFEASAVEGRLACLAVVLVHATRNVRPPCLAHIGLVLPSLAERPLSDQGRLFSTACLWRLLALEQLLRSVLSGAAFRVLRATVGVAGASALNWVAIEGILEKILLVEVTSTLNV